MPNESSAAQDRDEYRVGRRDRVEQDEHGVLHITERRRYVVDEGTREAIRAEAEAIITLASGPWSEGKNLPPDLTEAMVVRSEWYRKHAQAILDALEVA